MNRRSDSRRRAVQAASAALLALALPLGAAWGAALTVATPVNVSQTPTATEKAKVARLAYKDGTVFRKAWLYTYLDGLAGQQNVYARVSFDDGATWNAPVLLSRDGAGAATGGQSITTKDSLTFTVDNDMPNVFAPPTTSGPKVTIAWNSAYCPQDPAGSTSGSYTSTVQGTGDFNQDGTLDRPYHCLWIASTTDVALATWSVAQLTDGTRDVMNEVVGGNATGTGIGLAWQEDPAGLQPGEAEGPGDGGSGANVSGGTNIWYTFAASPVATTLRTNIVQVSDNNTTGTGQPGASRPNLSFSGATAVLAYEETACAGGSGGKCVVYHSFGYSTPDANSAGTIVSDVTHSARRVRIVLQGATAAGTSPLRTLLMWRDSPTAAPGAAADIIVRRGLADTVARPGSTGFLPSDILADTQQQLTFVAATGGNANAHRAVVRGDSVVLAYDATPDMVGADPAKTATPTATYNLYVVRSTATGAPATWSQAVNLSGIVATDWRVVEPRLVATPGTIVNPITGVPDAGDTQDTAVLYVAYSTEGNSLAAPTGRIYVSRSIDFGATFGGFTPVSAVTSGQSESQLRPLPDGSATMALWMEQQTPGDDQTKDAMFAVATVAHPDLALSGRGGGTLPTGQHLVSFDVLNKGPGDGLQVVLTGNLPAGSTLAGATNGGTCTSADGTFTCNWPMLLAGALASGKVTVSATAVGTYTVTATAASALSDVDTADNTATITISVADPGAPPQVSSAIGSGGGCTLAGGDPPVDPLLPLLAVLGAASALARAFVRRTAGHPRALRR